MKSLLPLLLMTLTQLISLLPACLLQELLDNPNPMSPAQSGDWARQAMLGQAAGRIRRSSSLPASWPASPPVRLHAPVPPGFLHLCLHCRTLPARACTPRLP